MLKDCIFCKIVSKEIPCNKVYEDDGFMAFLDIRPLNPGHCLVIPKKHYRWVWDVDDIEGYFSAVRKVANAQRKALSTEQVVSCIFGEEVHHAHVWLVPRFEGDGHGGAINLNNTKEISGEEMKNIAEQLQEQLKTTDKQ